MTDPKMKTQEKHKQKKNTQQLKLVVIIKKTLNFMAPFYGWGSTASRLHSHYKEAAYFLPITSKHSQLILQVQ